MSYTYSNIAPSQDVFETLYADSEKYLLRETLTSDIMSGRDCKDWLQEQLEQAPFHFQFFRDGKTICWFSGEKEGSLAKVSVGLFSPDSDNSRSYWTDTDFWSMSKEFFASEGLTGWVTDTAKNSTLHKTLIKAVEGKPQTQESFFEFNNLEGVVITMTYGDQ
jgi:hypothetical protein